MVSYEVQYQASDRKRFDMLVERMKWFRENVKLISKGDNLEVIAEFSGIPIGDDNHINIKPQENSSIRGYELSENREGMNPTPHNIAINILARDPLNPTICIGDTNGEHTKYSIRLSPREKE